MPVYTYRCESCGVQFERHQSFTDAPLRTCPECRKKTLKKVITPTKIIFKGSGFYATDHKSPSGALPKDKKSSSKEKESSGKESTAKEVPAKENSTSESKPASSEKSE
ncbi:MAG: zinc ribbon domain-containing protein, partial [Anaerolineales bacterium]|nr:zinc ribbon domain-containing protein [Anaerolineales bacterium]